MTDLVTRRSEQYGFPRLDFDVPDSPGGFVILPGKRPEGQQCPWVWHMPTFVTDPYPLPKPLHEWNCRRVLEAGLAIAGVDVAESWGSPAGREIYTAFHAIAARQFQLAGKACLYVQSRGGLMGLNWAVEHPELVQCIGGIYPLCNVTQARLVARIAEACGLTEEELLSQLDRHNPVDRLAPLAAAKAPILFLHGDSDDVVPNDVNSEALVSRYRQLGAPAEVIVIPGKGHEEVPEYFTHPALSEFYIAGGATVTCAGRGPGDGPRERAFDAPADAVYFTCSPGTSGAAI